MLIGIHSLAGQWFTVVLLVGISLGVGCSRTPPPVAPAAAIQQSESPATESVLDTDQRALQSSSTHLESLAIEMRELATSAPWRHSGYFDAGQQDQVESLLFRFLACRHTLEQLANHHRDSESRDDNDDTEAKSAVIAFAAGFRLVFYDASLVKAFRGDPIAIAKLNEEFFRSRIPAKTYDRLFLEVTNESQLKPLRDSFLLYSEELAKPDSSLAQVVQQSSDYRDLVESTESVASRADAIVQELVEAESRLLPTLDNRLRHTRVAELLAAQKH